MDLTKFKTKEEVDYELKVLKEKINNLPKNVVDVQLCNDYNELYQYRKFMETSLWDAIMQHMKEVSNA